MIEQHVYLPAVDIFLKVEDVNLERGFMTVKGWPCADVHHAVEQTVAALHLLSRINAMLGYQLLRIVHLNVGRRKTQFASLTVAALHLT